MGDATYGVNVFVPGDGPADPERSCTATPSGCAPRATSPATARYEDDDWQAKLDLLRERPPAVVSFTFGCPAEDTSRALREAGSEVWVTVTGPEEARLAQWAGATAPGGAGHRGRRPPRLVRRPRAIWACWRCWPCWAGRTARWRWWPAAGSPRRLRWLRCWPPGRSAAQVGTAFMRCPEAGTAEAHREALAQPGLTRVTRAFTGKAARGIENRFLREHPDAPGGLPGAASPDRADPCRRPRARRRRGAEPVGGPGPRAGPRHPCRRRCGRAGGAYH